MRYGFTTGTCAAAAAKGAALMALSGEKIDSVSISLPDGEKSYVNIIGQEIFKGHASCGVIKDAGDDPDVTDGIMICAEVMLTKGDTSSDKGVMLTGGAGIGRITRPGLENPVGEYAINRVPRQMIINEVSEVLELLEYSGKALVTIYVPDGERIAKKTFNPHLGIEGGISILGTSGRVKPMSTEALLETIRLDLSVKYAEGNRTAIMVPGNYGETFLKENYNISPERVVHFSNYIGDAIDMAKEIGFERVIITGHTGKMVKVTGGIMNTHSKVADCRMELMAAATMESGEGEVYINSARRILEQINTTAGLAILAEAGIIDSVCNRMLEKILFHLRKRAGDDMAVDCILYESSFGLLASSIDNLEEIV